MRMKCLHCGKKGWLVAVVKLWKSGKKVFRCPHCKGLTELEMF